MVVEYMDALPRAKLFSRWQIETNDAISLRAIADPRFNPHQLLIVSDEDAPKPNAGAPDNDAAGTVEINPNYKSKRVEVSADVKTPSILFMSEHYNPKWRVEIEAEALIP